MSNPPDKTAIEQSSTGSHGPNIKFGVGFVSNTDSTVDKIKNPAIRRIIDACR